MRASTPTEMSTGFGLNARSATAAVLAAAALLMSAACDRRPQNAENAGHEHASDARADGHGHEGHDHADAGHADEVKISSEAIERYGIKVEQAQLWALRPTFVAPARVGFNMDAVAHVGSPLRGRAVEVHVKLGDRVKKGDPLVGVESPELGQAQADYVQQFTSAQASAPGVELAKEAWERAKGLHEQSQGISLSEVQKREAEYKAALAAHKAADAGVTGAQNRLRLLGMTQDQVKTLARTGEIAPTTTIRAAIDGQVVQREVTLGELVNPERDALMVLADTSVLWVLADVPEARLHEVAVGATAWVSAGPPGAKAFEGKVAFVAPFVDAATRTAQVRIEARSEELALRPGMFAQVEIVATDPAPAGAEPTPTVAVPESAIQTLDGGPAVFVPVKGEPNTFARRAVTVGKTVGGLVPIYAGLVEGEQFVSASTFILKAELGKGSAAHEH